MVSDKSSRNSNKGSHQLSTTTEPTPSSPSSSMSKRNKLKSVQVITPTASTTGNGHNNDDNEDNLLITVDDSTTINGTRGGLGQEEEEEEGGQKSLNNIGKHKRSKNNAHHNGTPNLIQDLEHNLSTYIDLVTTATIDCWKSREDPLQWSVKVLPLVQEFKRYTIHDHQPSYVLCDILIHQMHVGASPSPLLVSYLRYAIATKMIYTTHLCDILYQRAQPDRPKHFSTVLSVISDIVNLPEDSFNALPPFIKKRKENEQVDIDIESLIKHYKQEQQRTTTTKDNKRKRPNGIPDEDKIITDEASGSGSNSSRSDHLLKKRKNHSGSFESIYEDDQQAAEGEEQVEEQGKNNDIEMNDSSSKNNDDKDNNKNYSIGRLKNFKEVEAVPKLMVILFKGLIYYFKNIDRDGRTNETVTTVLGNGIGCASLISIIIKNHAVSSSIYFCQFNGNSVHHKELTDLFLSIEKYANRIVIPYGISNVFTLELMTSIRTLLFTPYLPHDEIKYLAYDNSQLPINQDQSIIFQLLLEELITGTRLTSFSTTSPSSSSPSSSTTQEQQKSMHTDDIFYKLVCYRTVKNMTYSNFIFEIVRTLIQRLSLCMLEGATSAQFKKVKMVLLYRIPRLYESLILHHKSGDTTDTPVGSMEIALTLVLQICPELETEVILPLIAILIRKNLVSSSLMKEKFPTLSSDIDSLEIEIQNQLPTTIPPPESTLDSIYSSSDFQIRTLNDIKTIKSVLLALNHESSIKEIQRAMDIIKSNLITTFDLQDALVDMIFQVLPQIDPYNNRKVLVHFISMLSDPSVVDCIDVHGYILSLMVLLIKQCDSLGSTTNDPNVHSFFATPFNLLAYIIILYNFKNNQYNIDLLQSKLIGQQDISFNNPFIKWIYDTFRDTDVSFGSSFTNQPGTEGGFNEDSSIITSLLENNIDNIQNNILSVYSPWQIVHKLPQLLFLLYSCSEKNLTSPNAISDMISTFIRIVPYSSIVIFTSLAKTPMANELIQNVLGNLNSRINEVGMSELEMGITLYTSKERDASFQLNHYIPETLNLILYPVFFKCIFTNLPDSNHQSCLFKNQQQHMATESIMQLFRCPNTITMLRLLFQSILQPQSSSNIGNGVAADQNGINLNPPPIKLTDIPTDLLRVFIERTDVYQFVDVLSTIVLSSIANTVDISEAKFESITTTYLHLNDTIKTIELGGYILGNLVGVESISILLNSIIPINSKSLLTSPLKGQLISYFCFNTLINSNASFYISHNNRYITSVMVKFFSIINNCTKKLVVCEEKSLQSYITSLMSLLIHLNKSLKYSLVTKNSHKNHNLIFELKDNIDEIDINNLINNSYHQSIFSMIPSNLKMELTLSINSISNYFLAGSIFI